MAAAAVSGLPADRGHRSRPAAQADRHGSGQRAARRVRRPGGGRKRSVAQDPSLLRDLEQLVEPVSLGVDRDTAAFAVESIRRWWNSMGQAVYPRASRLPITVDSGGSNEARVRLWKVELQTALRFRIR